MTKIGIKESLTEASLGWNCFGLYKKDREFYTFKNKYVRDNIRKSNKGSVLLIDKSSQNNLKKCY